jgi:DNA-binding NtrC family response regulator/tetratricopeptide (TPR) repeat protein
LHLDRVYMPHTDSMLIADRFLSLDNHTIDLASGRLVLIRRLPSLDREQEMAWSDECATLVSLWDSPLVDYGVLDQAHRFEAFEPGIRLSRDSGIERHRTRAGSVSAADAAWAERLMARLLALFETARLGEPRLVRIEPPELLSPSVLNMVARHARLRGFVPLSMDLVASHRQADCPLRSAARPRVSEVLATRHVLLVAGAAAERGGGAVSGRLLPAPSRAAIARAIVSTGLATARPNVLLIASPGPAATDSPAAADEAAGEGSDVLMAAEAHEPYEVARPDLLRARTRAVEALAQARSGPVGRAEYALREVGAALSRREDAAGAAWIGLNLGCLLMNRGRSSDAIKAFERARLHFERANDTLGSMRAAIYTGLAWTDDLRLLEAEAAFRSVRIAAGVDRCPDADIDAALGFARCLYWQGRFEEALLVLSALLERFESRSAAERPAAGFFSRHESPQRGSERPLDRTADPVTDARAVAFHRRALAIPEPDREVRACALSARIGLALGDLGAASARAAQAFEAARRAARPLDTCTAHTALAEVACALKDGEGLIVHLRQALAAARLARAPLAALRLRILATDGLRRAGREREGAAFARSLARLDSSRLPKLLRARLQVVLACDGHPGPPVLAGQSGQPVPAGGFAVTMALAACPWRLPARRSAPIEDAIGVLQTCHDIEDEESALGRVCERVREILRAATVAVEAGSAAGSAVLARSGVASARAGVAQRALETGGAIAPSQAPDGIEAAAAIRYAGATIGVVSSRWAEGAIVDVPRATCLLPAAAAAVAPHVRSMLDRDLASGRRTGCDETELIGVSEAVIGLRRAIERAAPAPFPVLVEGESGSGKELVARAIHQRSARRLGRFCAVNCAALSDELLEAELFGHTRGAFTGAVSDRRGLFEEAEGGTLFLDEVSELSPRAQAKLLRAVQEGEVRRIGENLPRRVDARVVAATNRRLEAEIANGAFRRDLFYRLNVVHIDVPPLRDRPEDVPVLAARFWERALARTGGRATLSPAALAALSRYDWPGNVRELQNVMAALSVSAPRRGSVSTACLPAVIAGAEIRAGTLEQARRTFERRFVRAALARAGGHRGRTATALGLSRQGLAKLMARLELSDDDAQTTGARQ